MKIAVFVEGVTELEFTRFLIGSLCGKRSIDLEIREQHGGRLVLVSFTPANNATSYVLIVNCHSDEQVKTQIRDQYASLVAAGYTYIIGLRDIYPGCHADIPKYQAALYVGLPKAPSVPIDLHLAILEVEAWFLDEITHFNRIDPTLTIASMAAGGYDVENTFGNTWVHPAETLDNIYKIAGKRYQKKKSHIMRSINALSPDELYVNVRTRAPTFDRFLTSLENALF